MKTLFVPVLLLIFNSLHLNAQDTVKFIPEMSDKTLLSGFVRGGFYSWINKNDNRLYIPSAYSDFGLRLETSRFSVFKGYADVRFRYGSEFQSPVSRFDIREAYAEITGKIWDLTLGQKIIKWGRCDFTNPTSKLSPLNMISRSPDREDMDMGNLLSSLNLFPCESFNLEIVLLPYYRPSVLIIDPIPLPDNVKINQINSIITDKGMFSYGLKADFHLRGIDWSLSWFDGFDPIPGIALTSLNIDPGQSVPSVSFELSVRPYKNKVVGFDFETTAGTLGLRGEAAWSVPDGSYRTAEYIPMPELKLVAGTDWSSGIWRFTGEYCGKYITEFTPASAHPILGTDPDYSKIAEMMTVPGFDMQEYLRQQVGTFNRLYNYQLKEFSHSASLKAEAEIGYGKIIPSVITTYNFSYRDFLIIPEIRMKPSDRLTITAGAEIYSGRKGSLYRLIDDFMNSIYLSLKIDF
jgi:hypothetical protein